MFEAFTSDKFDKFVDSTSRNSREIFDCCELWVYTGKKYGLTKIIWVIREKFTASIGPPITDNRLMIHCEV